MRDEEYDGEIDEVYDSDYDDFEEDYRRAAIGSLKMALGEKDPEPEDNDLEYLTLEIADDLCNHAIATCRANKFNDFAVSVVNEAGNPIVTKVMDGLRSPDIPKYATQKAYTCIAVMNSSRGFRDKYTEAQDPGKFCQMISMGAISDGKLAPFPGGVLIRNLKGKIIGAVGVSGASADEDEYCALNAIQKHPKLKGFATVPEKHVCTTIKVDN